MIGFYIKLTMVLAGLFLCLSVGLMMYDLTETYKKNIEVEE
jgi:preprotein translocase subunit SecG